MITAMIDNGDGEWRLETVDAEQLDTGKREDFTINIDDIDFFAPDTPDTTDTGDALDFIAWMHPRA